MKLYILSTRRTQPVASNGIAVELEDLIVETCDAHLISPEVLRKRDRLLRRKAQGVPVLEGNAADRVLLVIALWTGLVETLNAIPNWRREFGTVAAFIFDPWAAWDIWPKNVSRHLDYFFLPDRRLVERFQKVHGVNAMYHSKGADVIGYGSNGIERPLDLVAYGRQHPEYMQVFEKAFNDPFSNRFVYHDTLLGLRARNFKENRRLIWKLLHKSQCALAFDTLFARGDRLHTHSIVPYRYYEGIAAGTVLVGKRPQAPAMDEDFDWQDSTIDLPDSVEEAVPFLEALLEDRPRLEEIHRRNYAEAWKRHDWRYRIRDMLEALNVPLPKRLVVDLEVLAGPPEERL